MKALDFILGKPISSSDARAEQIGVSAGIPIFGLDALSSAAYGPEAALTLLIPLGAAASLYVLPIAGSIIALLVIVYFSYRQTIQAYPGGGGSYTVARQNLGPRAGLLAAAALMIDYVLVAAVGISAGVGALVSAFPRLQRHTLLLCLAILIVVGIVNLRGVREAGIAFMIPTYLFIACLLGAIALGLVKTPAGGEQTAPAAVDHFAGIRPHFWMLLQAFAAGCTAMTGVEAVSNGVRAFREPRSVHARRTLTVIIATLAVMLAGIAYLVRAYGIRATPPGRPGYDSVLSMLLTAVAGRGAFYYVSIGSILAVLALSANTAFADFPRLCRAIAQNGYLPHSFEVRGRRLVYSNGILILMVLSGLLLILFDGVTDRLIPLFAVGAFLAFTLSQAGMVAHWKKSGGRGARRSMFVNAIGAAATGITVLIIIVAKFAEGAWVTVVLIPLLLFTMVAVKRHYSRISRETRCTTPIDLADAAPPIVVLPIQSWGEIGRKALAFALKISSDVRAVHVESEEGATSLRKDWDRLVAEPARKADVQAPELFILSSPFRAVVHPIVDFVLEVEQKNPDRQVTVVIPELVERHWYLHLLHNKRAALLKAMLWLKGTQQTVVVNVPWYLNPRRARPDASPWVVPASKKK
jgi:amino acid transporter